ncbi:MAG TPA: glycosyltransferase [Acidobacteriaceae bacterium]|nr:glycosyltransferase [Acidobacteriaceae bacterium]
MLPFVSVILPVRNERSMLPQLLDQLLAQNYPRDCYEILVVDGRSTDGTPDLIRRRFSSRSTPVRILDNPGILLSAGRNVGLRAARGDMVLFLNGHCVVPSRNLIEDSVALLERTGAGCLCRPQPLLAPAATDTGEVIAQARASWLGRDPLHCDLTHAGFIDPVRGGATYRRDVFERVGLYDESFDACEDVDLNTRVRRAGIIAFADPRLTVRDQPRAHVGQLFRDMLAHGRARLRLMSRHRGCFSATWLAPLALLLLLPVVAFAWWLLPTVAATILTLPLAAFAVAVVLASLQLSARCGARYAWRAPWIFSAIWFGLGSGLLLELLHPAPLRCPLECLAPRDAREEPEMAASSRRAA